MQSPFKQANSSSSSLEGMEQPVRPFKSFIKTVPPNPPMHNKPLPSAPSSARTPSPLSSVLSPSSPEQNHSIASWKAPKEWFHGSNSQKEFLQAPPIPSIRKYSPLLPEMSPDLSAIGMEPGASHITPGPPQQSRLLPIQERPYALDLGPPRTPPKSPLPTPPASSSRLEDEFALPTRLSPSGKKPKVGPVHTPLQTEFLLRTTSPAKTPMSATSSASTKEKAFASLGIGPSRKQSIPEVESYGPISSQAALEQTWPDRSYLRGKKLGALNKGSPLAEDGWEDTEMDDKTRQLSFSQDYHDLLADQYQEWSVRPKGVSQHRMPIDDGMSHVNRFGPVHTSPDVKLIPPPLSWDRSSAGSSPRSASHGRDGYRPNNSDTTSADPKRRRSRNIASWVPHRLSVGPKRQLSRLASPKSTSDSAVSIETATKGKQRRIPESQVDKKIERDLRFSRFFPPSKKTNEKHDAGNTNKIPLRSTPSPPHFPPAPFIRLPGGLAVVRTSSSPARKGHPTNPASTVMDHGHRRTNRTSTSGSRDSVPSSSNGSSYLVQTSQAAPVAPPIPVRPQAHGPSHSSTSRPLSREPLSSPPASTSQSQPRPQFQPQDSSLKSSFEPDAARRRFRGADGEAGHRPGFLGKAREARRRHAKDVRQERLKRSIRVLGPTDPGVVGAYVRSGGEEEEETEGSIVLRGKVRMPGYMAGS